MDGPSLDDLERQRSEVLSSDGMFLYTDVRPRRDTARWEAAIAGASGLRVVSWREINDDVLRGIQLNSAQMAAVMDSLVPGFLRRFARQGAPVQRSAIYRHMETGQFSYRMYCMARVA